MTNKTPARVILWSPPRSLSTVFTKCMSFIPNSLIWFEPYSGAMFYGPDRRFFPKLESEAEKIQLPEDLGYDATKLSYKDVQRELEAGFPDKSVVFVQGKPHTIDTRFDAIPRGYKHSFLIRHPQKVLISWKKAVYADAKFEGPYNNLSMLKLSDLSGERMPSSSYFFKEIYELYKHIKDNNDPNPPVIDADDLLMNPAGVLKAYCDAVGIPFTDDLLHLDSSDDVIKSWKISRIELQLHQLDSYPFYDNAFKSSEFVKPASDGPSPDDLTEDDIECIDFCMPFYKRLHRQRLIC